MWICAAVGGVCVLVVCRDHAATVQGQMSTLWLHRSAPLGALAHGKPTPVPTELAEIKLGYGMGLFPAPRSSNRIDRITCRAVIQAFTINWIFIDVQREGHSRKGGKGTFSLSSEELIHLQSCVKTRQLFLLK